MLPPFQLDQAINRLVREEWGRILAALVAAIGNLQLAEDALQDAVEVALVHWNQHGLPDAPAAWLLTTARRKAVDQLRRQTTLTRLQPALRYELEHGAADSLNTHDVADYADIVIPDKRLELMFTCCHPALDWKTRVALTLRTLGGLTTAEIANAFLDKPATMAQRLSRARHKISATGIAFEVPDQAHLEERLGGVLAVIYFIFNEGYFASDGQHLVRSTLGDEAIRLARVMHTLLPDDAEVNGLLALMLLHDSRRASRQSASGSFVPLEHQDRNSWNRQSIKEGLQLLDDALLIQKPGAYQIQAAISALHARAPDWQSTDWNQIVALYEALYGYTPSPVIKVNQAVALSYAQSADVALQLLDTIDATVSLQDYQPFHVARADLLRRTGQKRASVEQMTLAVTLSSNESDRAHLLDQLTLWRSLDESC